MTHLIVKYLLSAAVVVAVAEIAKRSSVFGGLVASLPLVSLLAIIWLYQETRDVAKVNSLCTSIFWLVPPSLVLFALLPVLLKMRVAFYSAFAASIAATIASYGLMIFVLNRFGMKF
jgi:hypothetical protein